MAAPLDREAERPVEGRYLVCPQALGLSLPEPDPGDPFPVLDLVIERRGVAADPDHAGQRLQPLAGSPHR